MCLFWNGEADCNHPHNVVWHFMQNKAFKQQNDISFSEVHKRNRSLGENGQSSTILLFVRFPQLLLGSPPQPVSHYCNPPLLNSVTSPFSSLCITGKQTMTNWDTDISQSISKGTKPPRHPATNIHKNLKSKTILWWYFCWFASEALCFLKKKKKHKYTLNKQIPS